MYVGWGCLVVVLLFRIKFASGPICLLLKVYSLYEYAIVVSVWECAKDESVILMFVLRAYLFIGNAFDVGRLWRYGLWSGYH